MLTDENKAFILKKINEGIQDYVVLANLLYNREDLTGRSKEAKLVRDFLLTTGFVKKQEKPNYCIPACIQAILRKCNIHEFQNEIAKELHCTEEHGVLFGENLGNFFKKRKISFQYYNFNEIPLDLDADACELSSYCFRENLDLIVGQPLKEFPKIHVELALDFKDPLIWLLDPVRCLPEEHNLNNIYRKMQKAKLGGFGLVRKL